MTRAQGKRAPGREWTAAPGAPTRRKRREARAGRCSLARAGEVLRAQGALLGKSEVLAQRGHVPAIEGAAQSAPSHQKTQFAKCPRLAGAAAGEGLLMQADCDAGSGGWPEGPVTAPVTPAEGPRMRPKRGG